MAAESIFTKNTEHKQPTPSHNFKKTKKRTLTKRAVMWIGQTCNARCYFCLYWNRIIDSDHPEHAFMPLEKAKKICTILRDFYDCTAIDIQGGEPTIHPQILELIAHCRKIGLFPTLITNGIDLAKPGRLEQFKEAGIREFLYSLHGIGDLHDEVVAKKGAYKKIIAAIERMKSLQMPFRLNCTMTKPVIKILPDIAQKAIDYGANSMNFITLQPLEDQIKDCRIHDNFPKYREISPYLNKAMDMLEEANIECNVRYFPFCMVDNRHRKNMINYPQLEFDHHEWDYQSWLWTDQQTQRIKEGDISPPFKVGFFWHWIKVNPHRTRGWSEKFPTLTNWAFKLQHILADIEWKIRGKKEMYRRLDKFKNHINRFRYIKECSHCSLNKICDGPYGDYVDLFGSDEMKPVTDISLVEDPLYYNKEQQRIVEKEDESWAL